MASSIKPGDLFIVSPYKPSHISNFGDWIGKEVQVTATSGSNWVQVVDPSTGVGRMVPRKALHRSEWIKGEWEPVTIRHGKYTGISASVPTKALNRSRGYYYHRGPLDKALLYNYVDSELRDRLDYSTYNRFLRGTDRGTLRQDTKDYAMASDIRYGAEGIVRRALDSKSKVDANKLKSALDKYRSRPPHKIADEVTKRWLSRDLSGRFSSEFDDYAGYSSGPPMYVSVYPLLLDPNSTLSSIRDEISKKLEELGYTPDKLTKMKLLKGYIDSAMKREFSDLDTGSAKMVRDFITNELRDELGL